ncbi:Gfo/Idh/MocA family oxidoreductase [Oscillospiraceae bacterium PP1C4]
MKVLVVGLGSMGKRRIRLMQRLYPEHDITGIDTSLARREEAEKLLGISTSASLQEAYFNSHFDAAFICTSPLGHGELITQCLELGLHIFTEINLVADRYDQNSTIAADKGLVLFLSSTPMYRHEILFITQKTQETEMPLSYSYHVGQYLPDWHPWENYQQFFVSNKRTNGCRELFGIELPWLLNAFGAVKSVRVSKSKKSNLKIDYDDSYLVLLEHQNGNSGVLMIDVVSRSAIRHLEVVGEALHLMWDGTPDTLKQFDLNAKAFEHISLYDEVEHREGYAANIVENAYCDEIRNFFDCIANEAAPKHTFAKDKMILKLIDTIEN